jgi:hypothetical protein
MHSTMNLVGVAALVTSLNAPIPSVQAPELAWPDAFASRPASEVGAHQHVVDFAGVRLKLTLPQSWEIQGSGPKGAWTALDLADGRRIEIAETIPTDFNFSAPATAEQLAGSIKILQANAPVGPHRTRTRRNGSDLNPAAAYLPPGRAGSIASNSSCVHGRVRLAVSARVALTVAASTGSPVCPHSRRM